MKHWKYGATHMISIDGATDKALTAGVHYELGSVSTEQANRLQFRNYQAVVEYNTGAMINVYVENNTFKFVTSKTIAQSSNFWITLNYIG